MCPDPIVICFRVVDSITLHIKGVLSKDTCSVCKDDVYLSPEDLKQKEEDKASVYCFNCAIDLFRHQ